MASEAELRIRDRLSKISRMRLLGGTPRPIRAYNSNSIGWSMAIC